MANVVYPMYKQAQGTGAANTSLTVDTRAMLVDLADYTYSDTHDFLADVPAVARVATMAASMSGLSVSALGVFDAGDVTYTAVTGDPCEAIIIYTHTGSDATARLVAFLDTGVTGLPVSPNGGNIGITWAGTGIIAF